MLRAAGGSVRCGEYFLLGLRRKFGRGTIAFHAKRDNSTSSGLAMKEGYTRLSEA
jgi:hypothetical protein